MNHEEALVRAFITPKKRARYLDKLASPQTRASFIARHFYHMADLDERYAERLDPRMPTMDMHASETAHSERIYDLLRGRGAPPDCYVASTDPQLDGREADLKAILAKVVGSREGTFISCIPGRLAYYEGEDDNDRFVLERPQES